jgi:hypothetical protein
MAQPNEQIKPVYMLLICLAVALTMFGGSILLSVFYVEQPKVAQSDP